MHEIERTLRARLRDPAIREQWNEFLAILDDAPTLFDVLVFLELIGDAPLADTDDWDALEALMQRPLAGDAGRQPYVKRVDRRTDH